MVNLKVKYSATFDESKLIVMDHYENKLNTIYLTIKKKKIRKQKIY